MKSALIASIILVLLSFGTTVLMYDFSGSSKVETNNKTLTKTTTNSPAKTVLSQASMATTSTSTLEVASSTEKLAMENNNATQTKTTSKPKPATTITTVPKKEVTVSSTQTTSTTVTPIPPKVITPKPTPTVNAPVKPTLPPTSKNPISWGVFTGSNPNTIRDFESRVSENPDYLAYFVHWGNGEGALPAFLSDYAYKKDRTLVLFWEASDYQIGGTDQPDFSYSTILRGDWDDYFINFAKQLEKYKGPVILIPFSELNGNWTPWSGTKNGNTPEQAVAAFQYVHSFFADIPNVKIGWAVNSTSVPQTPENQIANYYPGDAFVDIVGVDGFNMNWPWLSFDAIFGNPLRTLSQYNKPMFVFSFATAEGEQKADWLDDALNIQMPKYPLLTGWIYFNQDKERNWLLWSDEETFSVFENYISK